MVLGIEQEPPVCQDNCTTTQLHPGLCGDSLNGDAETQRGDLAKMTETKQGVLAWLLTHEHLLCVEH